MSRNINPYFETSGSVALYHDGVALADDGETRRSLLESLSRGEHVEIEVEAVTYSVGADVENRNYHDLSPAALREFAKKSKERRSPFVRDHSLSTEDVGGFVVDSRVASREGGGRELRERIRLNEPWSVRAALTENMSRFSIHWQPASTEDIHCSACKATFLACDHFPGEMVRGKAVSLISQSADPVERSWVVRPAVEATGVTNIRTSLAEARTLTRETRMNEKLAEMLGCESDESAVLDAVRAALAERGELDTVRSELAQKAARVAELETELAAVATERLAAECDELVSALLSEGAVAPGGAREKLIRDAFAEGRGDYAAALAESYRERASVPPLGAQSRLEDRAGSARQSDRPDSGAQIELSAQALFDGLPEAKKMALSRWTPQEVFKRCPELLPPGINPKDLT